MTTSKYGNGTAILLAILGSPFSAERRGTDAEEIDFLFPFAFENRVALLLLETCKSSGIQLSNEGEQNYLRLMERMERTRSVVTKLAIALNESAPGGWVLFKSLKPFPSTPNDTDWFPLDKRDHARLCRHLETRGFSFLERAPLQVTLIANEGIAAVHSDKRGGVYYIDCYIAPGADYFVYLDPAKMKRHMTSTQINGVHVPLLSRPAELAAIMFHNVFPEKTFSLESFYLVLHYLIEMEKHGEIETFVDVVRESFLDRAVYANLVVTAELHRKYFGTTPQVVTDLISKFGTSEHERKSLAAASHQLPYNFSARSFWQSFFGKLKEPIALKSAFIQLGHMLNPLFFAEVVRVIWRRMRPGGVYKQM